MIMHRHPYSYSWLLKYLIHVSHNNNIALYSIQLLETLTLRLYHINAPLFDRFACKTCGKTFSRKDNFKQHVQRREECRKGINEDGDIYSGMEELENIKQSSKFGH